MLLFISDGTGGTGFDKETWRRIDVYKRQDNSNGRLDVDYESMSIKDLEKVKKQIEKNMRKAAAELDFEQAAMLRDKMIEINKYIYEDKKSGR